MESRPKKLQFLALGRSCSFPSLRCRSRAPDPRHPRRPLVDGVRPARPAPPAGPRAAAEPRAHPWSGSRASMAANGDGDVDTAELAPPSLDGARDFLLAVDAKRRHTTIRGSFLSLRSGPSASPRPATLRGRALPAVRTAAVADQPRRAVLPAAKLKSWLDTLPRRCPCRSAPAHRARPVA